MLHELRIYHIHPGKMQAINERFSKHTLGIFAKHGMRVTEFWQDVDPEHNRLYYVMEFENMETRDQKFAEFRNDPEWQKIRSESEKDGPIVDKVESVFLKRVGYFS
ncbi:NIPSNAP family protein [Paenibacillus xerothermodurans]|uniref:NIPSNAP family protein n=1 Tax=Paenibacillus xerothermodurans TaxID=1977292 RepID=A0A2W1N775_PAEXE|nr:NIPSNAP family protein [Paenibacillus xerothermodurans]PZE19684.1 NIPSNAP family protein [Paenibacillus xerothermodurans]